MIDYKKGGVFHNQKKMIKMENWLVRYNFQSRINQLARTKFSLIQQNLADLSLLLESLVNWLYKRLNTQEIDWFPHPLRNLLK